MRLFYFVHMIGAETDVGDVSRVATHLGRELAARSDVDVVAVSWNAILEALVHAEQRRLDNFARHDGPELHASDHVCEPIDPAEGDWLLIAGASPLQIGWADAASVLIDELIGYARRAGLKAAVIVQDILPLTYGAEQNARSLFAEPDSPDQDTQRLWFVAYAHGVALADLVLTGSRTTADELARWLIRHGHEPELLPPIVPVALPAEAYGTNRCTDAVESRAHDSIEFLSVSPVSSRRNQVSAMAAFQRLAARRPELDLRFTIVGPIAGRLVAPVSLLAKRSRGRIRLLGPQPESRIPALMRRAHATVFVSIAEGHGLPIAVSLWHGKPCLCSGQGSMGEIARGGGCLTVDPGNLDEIEAGFERLATDEAFYNELLREIAARPLKTWKRYAVEILREIAACSGGERGEIIVEEEFDDRKNADAAPAPALGVDAVRIIQAGDFTIPDACGAHGRPRSLYDRSAIRYEQERDQSVAQSVLFYGPYLALPQGRYAFWFDGELRGELMLAFTAASGEAKLANVSLATFDSPVSIDLDQPVERFEIVGRRTPNLKRMILRAVFIEFRGSRASEADPRQTTARTIKAPASFFEPGQRLGQDTLVPPLAAESVDDGHEAPHAGAGEPSFEPVRPAREESSRRHKALGANPAAAGQRPADSPADTCGAEPTRKTRRGPRSGRSTKQKAPPQS